MDQKLRTERRKLADLKAAEYNPRKALTPDDAEYQKIRRSIEEFGYVDPIIINEDGTIIGGHQRATVLKDLGYQEVDVVVVALDKQREKALNIALNKITGEWDEVKLKDLLLDLDLGDYDISLTGFEQNDLTELVDKLAIEPEAVDDDFNEDEALEQAEAEPVTKLGDVWLLGRHRLMCGDSTSQDDMAVLMNGEIADLVVTDPPYNVNYGDKAEMGYWIRQYSVDGMALSNPVYVDAKDVIFLYTKHRPSQVREMSDMSPTITRIRDANEFMIAVSVKERIAACLSVFIKKQLPTTGIGRQNGSVPVPHQDYQGKSIAPGMIKELNAGDEIQVVNPTGQATDAASYIKLQQRLVGAGQGISYEATSRDMSESNYSSTRQGIIEDDMTYAEEKEMLMEVMDEIYETFVISMWLAGELEAKDFWENKDKYFEHAWITAPKKWIDPQKEANANKIALNTGQKTFKQIAAEQGRDWKEQIDEMAEVLEYAKDKGIDLGGVIFDQTAAELYEDEEPANTPQEGTGQQAGEETGQEAGEGDGTSQEGEADNQGTDG